MKKLSLLLLVLIGIANGWAQNIKYTEATGLTMLGQLFTGNPVPYHRLDTVRFKGFTSSENIQVRQSSGLCCAFKTNSPSISVQPEYGQVNEQVNTGAFAARGFDLYIRKDGRWTWAASGAPKMNELKKAITLITDMDGTTHECLLYFPLFAELKSVKIGVKDDCQITPLPNALRHRVGIWGSSFTHGASCNRAGMSYPNQFARHTGIQLLGLGCSGNCKMQPYFVDALCQADVEAFIFDTFSNPNPKEISERLMPMIERLTKAHPGKPLIFQRTICRGRRTFNLKNEAYEASRIHLVDSLMNIACKKYPDVYYIHPSADTKKRTYETSQDGTHPTDHGYTLWAESIEKPVLKILRKYGIR